MAQRRLRFATNFERFPQTWNIHSVLGESVHCKTPLEFWRVRDTVDLFLVNCDPGICYWLGALRRLVPWLMRKPALAVDLILLAPKPGFFNRCLTRLKRFSLGGIWHFIHHFRDLSGYQKFYNIGSDRSSYLPFKVNLRLDSRGEAQGSGSYVLCLGRSERDYDTFFAAMEKLPAIPAAIPAPDLKLLATHGSRFTRDLQNLPANITLLADQGDEASILRFFQGARLAALPLIPGRIKASGISVYLNAMRMGKCVITNEGPGTSDVLLNGEAFLIPSGDADALATAIEHLWNNHEERLRIARAGELYAQQCGDEADSFHRILERAVQLLQADSRARL
jgi:glycosyltransferase involved in cell wall biosynthesis